MAGLDRASQDAAGLMRRIAADAAAARFAPAREKVPAFSAWAFDWVQSYVHSFRMLGAMLRGVADSAADGDVVEADALVQRMGAPMRAAFHDRVLAPAGLAEGLAGDLANAGAMLEVIWARGLVDATRPIRDARAAAASPAPPRLDLQAAIAGLAVEVAEGTGALGGGVGSEPGSDPTSIFVHSMRPMAARLSAVALRASEAGSLLAAGGAVGFAMGGATGLVVGTASGVGLYWAIDWGFNRVDAALNRSDFEARALDAIDRAETAFVAALDRAATAAITRRHPGVSGAAVGCPAGRGGR